MRIDHESWDFPWWFTPFKQVGDGLHHGHLVQYLTMRSAKNMQHDTSKVLRLPRKMTSEVSKSAAPAKEDSTHLLKTWQKYCACHTQSLLTRHETCWNITKCHACHAKRSYAKRDNSKELTTGTAIAISRERLRTVANGCGRLRNVWRTQLNPHTPRVKREPLLRIREKTEGIWRISHLTWFGTSCWKRLEAESLQAPVFFSFLARVSTLFWWYGCHLDRGTRPKLLHFANCNR